MSVRIIVDSTADIVPELKAQMKVVPLTIIFGAEEYTDGVTITNREFYEKLIEGDELPTTSQASPAVFAEVFEEVVSAGDTAVVLTVSSGLSGTYQSAVIAAEDYTDKVFVVDTKSVAIGSGILAERALNLAKEGMDAGAIALTMEKEREQVRLIAMLDTLEYLMRGGRISRTAAIAGGLLNIKPVVAIRNGKIETLGKARGSRQGNNLLVKEIEAAGGVDFEKPLLRKYVKDSAALWEGHADCLRSAMIGSVVGTHAGPGAVAVAFFAREN